MNGQQSLFPDEFPTEFGEEFRLSDEVKRVGQWGVDKGRQLLESARSNRHVSNREMWKKIIALQELQKSREQDSDG